MINCGIGFSTRFCVKPCIFDAICPRRGLARSFVARAGPRWGSNPCLSFSFHLADAASSCYKPYVNLIIKFSILKVTLTADAIWILYLPFGNVEMSTCRLKPRRLKSVKINGNFMNLWIPRPLAIVKSWKRRETIFRNIHPSDDWHNLYIFTQARIPQIWRPGTHFGDFWSQGQKMLKSDFLGPILSTSGAEARKSLNPIKTILKPYSNFIKT